MRTRYLLASTIGCLSVLSGANAQSVDYGMLEQLFGEPVTTSAIGSPQKASDVPANMQIISSDEIRRSGALSIPDILRLCAGIDVRSDGAAGANVSIRGYNSTYNSRLLVLVNGRQVYIDDFSYVAWQAIPVQLDEIRQIEVVKGPTSALFGFNAVSGVINIITVDPLSDSTDVATLRGGTRGYGGGDGVTTIHAGNFGLRLSVGGYRADESPSASLPPADLPINSNPYQHSFAADARYKPTENSEITAEATFSDSQNYELSGPGGPVEDAIYRTNSIKVGGAADTSWGLVDLTAYRNEVRSSFAQGAAPFSSLRDDVYIVQASDIFKLGTENTIRTWVEYRNDYGASGAVYASSVGYADYAASIMWNWQIDPRWTLTNALRVDYLALSRSNPSVPFSPFSQSDFNKGTITAPSFNSGLVYKPSDEDTLRLLVSRGVQAPSLVDLGLQLSAPISPTTHLVLTGNPNLNASSVMNYEVDYDRAVPALNATVRTAFYYQKTDQILSSALSQPFIVLPGFNLLREAANIGSSSAFGGEIGIQGARPSGLRWKLAYSLVRIADDLTVGTSGNPAPTPWNFTRGTPTNSIDFGLGYSWDKFEADLGGKWQSSFTDYLSTNVVAGIGYVPVVIKDYVTVNGRVGYNLTDKITVAVTGQQLNQQTIYESVGLPVERRGILSLTLHY